MALQLNHQTAAELAARFRARYRTAEREDCARMATWLLNRIDAGDSTDAQVRAAFGMNTVQYTTFKTSLTTLRSHWLAVQSARGE